MLNEYVATAERQYADTPALQPRVVKAKDMAAAVQYVQNYFDASYIWHISRKEV